MTMEDHGKRTSIFAAACVPQRIPRSDWRMKMATSVLAFARARPFANEPTVSVT
jgi:hypothetical protein